MSSIQSPEPSVTPIAALWRADAATTLSELDALEDAWSRLMLESATPSNDFSWSRSAAETLPAGRLPRVAVVARGETIVGLAPLAVMRSLSGCRLAMLGVAELQEPMDLVAADAEALERLCSAFVRLGLPVTLGRLPAESPTLAALASACRGRAFLSIRPQPSAPYIKLDSSWAEPESHLNAGRRSDLRRARRKAEKIGPVISDIITPRARELEGLLDLAIEIESRSWKGKAGTALAYDAERQAFYRSYAQRACAEGALRLCFLYIDEQPAAMQIALEQNGGFWLLKVGYDEAFAQASPGQLLLAETIRHAVRAGLQTYEFLGRTDPWTRVWTKNERRYVAAHVYPYSPRGLTALAVDGARSLARRRRTL